MNKEELAFLINQGESFNIEFKESYSDSIAKEICAFSNANGGKILIGIRDNKEIKGINITNKLKSQIHDLVHNFDPKFNIILEEIEDILVINVPEGNFKPYSVNGKFYVRYGTNSQQLSRDEIRDFFQKEGLVLFDEKLNCDFNIKTDFNKIAFKTFLKRSGIKTTMNNNELLSNLALTKGNVMKNAGVLLFSKDVSRFFINATITCVLFQGTSKATVLDKKEFTSDIYSNYINTMKYLKSKLNTNYIITSERNEKLELPEEALREALMNAIAHRNYSQQGANIQVAIFLDRVEINNPGGLVNGIKLEELGTKSLSRNNLLFGLLQRMRMVEKIGSGIRRMREQMKEYGLENPIIETNEHWFTIIFKRTISNNVTRLGVKLGVKLGVNQVRIIKQINENKYITADKLSKILSISTTAVENNLKKLKNMNYIRRVGSDKSGYWEIIKNK